MLYLLFESIKRKLCRPLTVVLILVSMGAFLLSFYLLEMDKIILWFENITGSAKNYMDSSPEMLIRQQVATAHFAEPSLFNLGVITHKGGLYLHYLLYFFCAIPAIIFFSDRKNGFIKNVLVRASFNQVINAEIVSTFIFAFTLTFIPQFVFWAVGAIIFPPNIGLDFQSFSSIHGSMLDYRAFSFLFNPEWNQIYYLLRIFFQAIYFGILGVLVLLMASFINKRVYLYFIPIAYYYILLTVVNVFDAQRYGPPSFLSQQSSYSHLLVPLFVPLFICWILSMFLKKERVIHA